MCKPEGVKHFLLRSEGKLQNPLMPSIYLDGMAACFSNLARRFASNGVNGSDNGPAESPAESESRLPDGDSRIFRSYVFGPSGSKDYGSATLRCKI